jgi:hypothetical protein
MNNINNNYSLDNLSETVDGVKYVEVWKDVNGYEGKYQISSFGRVKSLKCKTKKREKILKSSPDSKGYRILVFIKNKKRKMFSVHRLVGLAFIPNLENKPTIQHKYYDVADNRFHQLEWFTYSEQHLDAFKKGKRDHVREISRRNIPLAYRKQMKPVYQYDLENNFIKSFPCLLEAAQSIGLTKMAIYNCIIGTNKTAGGYIWKKSKSQRLNK